MAKMADVLDFDLRSINEDDDFGNSNDEIILETQLTEVENYVEEIIYGVMSEIRRKKMRLDINNIYKYANRAGITEIETRKAIDILKRKNIIESKTSKGKMESFRIVNKEMVYDIADSSIIPEENNIYLKKIYEEIGVLKKQVNDMLPWKIIAENLQKQNEYLSNEIKELTSFLDTIVKVVERQSHSGVTEHKFSHKVNFKLNDSETINSSITAQSVNDDLSVNDVTIDSLNKDDNDEVYISGDVSNKQINSENKLNIHDQLLMVRKKYKTDFYEKKDKENNQASKEDNTVQTVTKWNKDTILITGDSILYGIDEKKLSKNGRVKVRLFPGATVDDMYSYLQPLIDKSPSVLILHVGTNNAPTFNSRQILDKMINLKNHVMERLPNCKVVFSTPVMRTDNGKATLTIKKLNQILHEDIAVDLVNK